MAGIRSFIAIKLNEEICYGLARVAETLQAETPARAVRWVEADKIHLTLKFLGDVGPSQIEPIADAVRTAAGQAGPFSFEASGLGCFPNPRRPRVIWVGVREPGGALRALHDAIDAELERLGFEPERRRFSPHLTLGRVRRETPSLVVREIGQLVESMDVGVIGRQEVAEIHLFKSDLRPTGAIYTSLAALPLGESRK